MARTDDDARKPGGVQKPLLLVGVPAARLLREESPLKAVGKPRDDVRQAGHLLVEIGTEPRQLLFIAKFFGFDDFVEASSECLIIGGRREVPIAAPGRGEQALAHVVAGGGLLLARFRFLGRVTVGILIFDLFAAPVPGAEEQALAVAREALDAGGSLDVALGYGRLVQAYELMFWNRLADLA